MAPDPEIRLRVRGDVAAPMSVVFATVTDHPAYASWSAWDDSELERAGEEDRNGFGAVRILRDRTTMAGRVTEVRELVNLYWPPYLFGYRALENELIRDHQGVVIVRSMDPANSRVIWHLTASAVDPAHTTALQHALEGRLERIMADLCSEAARRASEGD